MHKTEKKDIETKAEVCRFKVHAQGRRLIIQNQRADTKASGRNNNLVEAALPLAFENTCEHQTDRHKQSSKSQSSLKREQGSEKLGQNTFPAGIKSSLAKSYKSQFTKEKIQNNQNQHFNQNIKVQQIISKEQQLRRKMIAKQLKNDFYMLKLKTTTVTNQKFLNKDQTKKWSKALNMKKSVGLIDTVKTQLNSPKCKSQDKNAKQNSFQELLCLDIDKSSLLSGEVSFSEAEPQMVYHNNTKLKHFEICPIDNDLQISNRGLLKAHSRRQSSKTSLYEYGKKNFDRPMSVLLPTAPLLEDVI